MLWYIIDVKYKQHLSNKVDIICKRIQPVVLSSQPPAEGIEGSVLLENGRTQTKPVIVLRQLFLADGNTGAKETSGR